jgi:hypothetical protein
MFRKIFYLFSFVLVLSLVSSASAQEPDILIRSPDLAMPVIDGVVDDVWSVATEQDILITTSGSDPSGPADCSGKWRVLWDWEYIYALVIVKDEALNNDSGAGSQWNDDSVEFYVDGDNSKLDSVDENDHQYTSRWNNAELEAPSVIHNGAPSAVGFEYAIVTTGSGYIYESRIPWTSIIAEPPGAGDLIGIDMYINDDDDGDGRDTQIAWYSPEGAGWNTPSMWVQPGLWPVTGQGLPNRQMVQYIRKHGPILAGSPVLLRFHTMCISVTTLRMSMLAPKARSRATRLQRLWLSVFRDLLFQKVLYRVLPIIGGLMR